MKKLFALILLFITLQSQAQYPVTQYMGSSNVVVKSRGGLGTDSTFTFATSYSDTSALNRGFLKNIPGVMARVGDNLYLRSALADRWILLGSTSGGVNIYNSNGTLTGNRTLSGGNFQMDMTGFSDFNIVSNGGIGLSYDDGIYGSGTITHNTGAVGFDISHLASGESSIMNFGTGFLKLATDNSYVRVDQTDVKVSTASLQLLNIPRLGMIGKRVLVKDTITNQVSEVAIDSLGGGGTQTLQTVTDNGDSTTNSIKVDSVKGNYVLSHGQAKFGDSAASGRVAVWFGDSQTTGGGCISITSAYPNLISMVYGWNNLNRAISGTKLTRSSVGDSSMIDRLYLIPTYNSSTYSWISFMYGANDRHYLGFDTATYKTSYSRVVDTCVARGWPKNRIVIYSPSYSDNSLLYCPNMSAYATAAQTIAGTKGVVFLDAYNYMAVRGATALTCDSLHPSIYGSIVIEKLTVNSNLVVDSKVGNVVINGSSTVIDTAFNGKQVRIGAWTPSYVDPNYFLLVGGSANVAAKLRVGNFTTDLDGAITQIRTSANQVGVSVWNGGADYNRHYAEFSQWTNSSGSTKMYGNGMNIGSVSGNFTVLGGSSLKVAEFGSSTGVTFNGDKYQGGFLQQKGTGSSYLLFASPPTDRVGIRDSVPQQTLSVRGSGSFTDTLWGKGAVKFDGLTSAVGNKALRINTATGMISYADTTTSGGGSVTSVSGTTNRITSTGGTTPVIDISASYVGQSSITTMGTVTSGGLGTGATLGGVTPSLGSDATGDLYYRNSGGVLTRLPIGTSKQTLHVVGGIPAWRDTTASGSSSGTNLYVRINKTISDSIAYAPNDSTLVLKSVDVVSSDSTIKVTKTITDSTLKYSLTLRTDTCALASFAGGGANAGDTTAFTTSTIYGSFFNSLSDTLVITNLRIGLQGTSPSVGVTVYWNDSLAVTAGATKLVNAGSTATNIYTGTSVTSFDNTKIPPGVWVWVQTTAVTTKPTYMTATLIGYKKRTQ